MKTPKHREPGYLDAVTNLYTELVRCRDCRYYERTNHPHLGHCATGEPEPPGGMWDSTARACETFSEAKT